MIKEKLERFWEIVQEEVENDLHIWLPVILIIGIVIGANL